MMRPTDTMDQALRDAEPLVATFARQLYARTPLAAASERDDFEQVVRIAAWRLLVAEGVPTEWDGAWAGRLWMRARSATRDLAESGGSTGLAGATGARRRARSLATTRRTLPAGTPADVLIAAHNGRVTARRSDPGKQGALVTAADLAGPASVPAPAIRIVATVEDHADAVVSRLDAAAAVALLWSAQRPKDRRILDTWLAVERSGRYPSSATVARHCGVPRGTIERRLHGMATATSAAA